MGAEARHKHQLDPGFLLILTTLEFIQKYRNHDIINQFCFETAKRHQGCLGTDSKRNLRQDSPSNPTVAPEPDPDNMTDASWQLATYSYCWGGRGLREGGGKR